MPGIGLMLSDVPATVPVRRQFSDLLRYAEAAQRNRFSHIALGQHFLYGDLRWLQPVPVLARLAAEVASEMRLVTNVMVGSLYHPVILAEELATLDIVTEGRLVIGLGIGYRPEEFALLQVPKRERGARLDEAIDLMKLLWAEDTVDFEGRFFTLEGARPHIRPIQRPHPPLWIGGHSDAGARRAGRRGDGFVPAPGATIDEIGGRYELVRREFALRGREVEKMPLRRNVWIASSPEEAIAGYEAVAGDRYRAYARRGLDVYGSHDELAEDFATLVAPHVIAGSPDDVVEELRTLAATLPVDPIILRCGWPSMTADETLAQIDLVGKHVLPALDE